MALLTARIMTSAATAPIIETSVCSKKTDVPLRSQHSGATKIWAIITDGRWAGSLPLAFRVKGMNQRDKWTREPVRKAIECTRVCALPGPAILYIKEEIA